MKSHSVVEAERFRLMLLGKKDEESPRKRGCR